MALVKGVNCGFVTVAPTTDPGGYQYAQDTRALAVRDVAPTGVLKVVEIGWWCDNATEAANTEVGIYSHDAGNNKPLNLLGSVDFAKGITLGWKKAAVDISITGGVIYWMASQLDDTVTQTIITRAYPSGQYVCDGYPFLTALPNPWNIPSATYSNQVWAIYALWQGAPMKINIGDAWKDVDSMELNIGDVWKDVIEVKQNIGDVWKTVF